MRPYSNDERRALLHGAKALAISQSRDISRANAALAALGHGFEIGVSALADGAQVSDIMKMWDAIPYVKTFWENRVAAAYEITHISFQEGLQFTRNVLEVVERIALVAPPNSSSAPRDVSNALKQAIGSIGHIILVGVQTPKLNFSSVAALYPDAFTLIANARPAYESLKTINFVDGTYVVDEVTAMMRMVATELQKGSA